MKTNEPPLNIKANNWRSLTLLLPWAQSNLCTGHLDPRAAAGPPDFTTFDPLESNWAWSLIKKFIFQRLQRTKLLFLTWQDGPGANTRTLTFDPDTVFRPLQSAEHETASLVPLRWTTSKLCSLASTKIISSNDHKSSCNSSDSTRLKMSSQRLQVCGMQSFEDPVHFWVRVRPSARMKTESERHVYILSIQENHQQVNWGLPWSSSDLQNFLFTFVCLAGNKQT